MPRKKSEIAVSLGSPSAILFSKVETNFVLFTLNKAL